MPLVPAHNPTDTAVIVDPDGRQIAPGDWGVADDSLAEVADAASAGRLHLYQAGSIDDGPGQNPDAVAAAEWARTAETRRQAFGALPASQAAQLARETLGMSEEDSADDEAVLRGLALSSVEVPRAEAAPPAPGPTAAGELAGDQPANPAPEA